MLFNSIHFLLFFPVVVGLYFLIPYRFRWILLLISSYYFYMSWKAEYAILILASTLINYLAALQIERHQANHRLKCIFLTITLASDIGMLFAFKYFNFVSSSLAQFLHLFSIPFDPFMLNVLLPVGISFYTFQTMSYSIDVYRGHIKAERHFGIFAVYVSFFPQLVAGPIERAKNLLPQFFEKHDFNYKLATDGFKLMLWGFFKKIVIADRLALGVNAVYNSPTDYTGLSLIIATVFFAIQIYCDFSGYSDIAIGSAQIMGYKLMDNFKRPFFSSSIAEFWTRWHISLSTWFRDYIYQPLLGTTLSIPRWYGAIFITFLISGVWHGANWTFIVWGVLHGLYLIGSLITQPLRERVTSAIKLTTFPRIHLTLKIGITFSLVCISFVFFRANSLTDAFYILSHMLQGLSLSHASVGMTRPEFITGCLATLFLIFVHAIQEHTSMRQFMSTKPLLLRWFVYIVIVLSILLFGIFQETPFIYFQF